MCTQYFFIYKICDTPSSRSVRQRAFLVRSKRHDFAPTLRSAGRKRGLGFSENFVTLIFLGVFDSRTPRSWKPRTRGRVTLDSSPSTGPGKSYARGCQNCKYGPGRSRITRTVVSPSVGGTACARHNNVYSSQRYGTIPCQHIYYVDQPVHCLRWNPPPGPECIHYNNIIMTIMYLS